MAVLTWLVEPQGSYYTPASRRRKESCQGEFLEVAIQRSGSMTELRSAIGYTHRAEGGNFWQTGDGHTQDVVERMYS
jgi:hypothetical protein